MPVSSDYDETRLDEIEKEQGGKGLRAILEEALAENRNLTQENTSFRASKVLEENGLDLVKPEDLAGVAADEMETKAQELQEQRQQERLETVKAVLADKGLEGDDLDAAVQNLLDREAPAEERQGGDWTDVRELTDSAGDYVPARPDGGDILGTNWFLEAEAEAKNPKVRPK